MLETPLSKALRTTSGHLQKLKILGIETVKDFLKYFPRAYTDGRDMKRIVEILPGIAATVRGTIKTISTSKGFRGRVPVTRAIISDDSGSIEAIWFNRAYLARILEKGSEVILFGKAKFDKR